MVLMNEIGTIARRRVSSRASQVKSSQVKFDRLPYGCLLFMYRLDLTSRAFPQSPRQDVETNFDVENCRGIR
jgi:hypothetical protein